MDVDRLLVGVVAFGSVACRHGCLWLGGMYNCNTIFHMYTCMHICIYTYMYMYIYIYTGVFVYLHICIHVQMYMWDLENALASY